jgi:hypothetical protein
MRYLTPCGATILAALCLGPIRGRAQTAEGVIDRYVAAIGGYAAIDGIQTLRYDRILTHIDERRVIATRVYQKRLHRHRIETASTGSVRIVNGDRAWRCTLDPGTGRARWEETGPWPETDFAQLLGLFVHFEQKGYSVAFVGTVSREGRRWHELTLDRPGAATWALFFDVETGLFEMFEAAPGTVVTLHDYRDVNGVLFPHLSEVRGVSAQGTPFHHLNTVTDLVLDAPLPDALFLPPEGGGPSRGCSIAVEQRR